ncbi:hypothetical protein vnz_36890 (plasmid) [Streptomyces venezuelae]|nr:hypothetical protein vnz_36890 [Streptomyces venezuelae]
MIVFIAQAARSDCIFLSRMTTNSSVPRMRGRRNGRTPSSRSFIQPLLQVVHTHLTVMSPNRWRTSLRMVPSRSTTDFW